MVFAAVCQALHCCVPGATATLLRVNIAKLGARKVEICPQASLAEVSRRGVLPFFSELLCKQVPLSILAQLTLPCGCMPVQVISTHPPVLSYSVDGRLVPFWDYLTQIGVTDVAAAVVKRPSLLGLSVDANLRKIVDYLESIETPPEKIVQYICTSI